MAVSTGLPHRPAKAMAVSVETQPARAKATAVSDNHTPGVRAPTTPPAGIYAPTPHKNSHAIRLGEISIMSENVAISTL